jgi:uncharacterized membrane protein YqiK
MPTHAEGGVDAILAKLDSLASADLLRRMQGQMVKDREDILASVAALRAETRTEVAGLRAANDVTNVALNAVSDRVKKIESRSLPPRGSPMPRAYDLGAPTEKLVERLNELEADQDATRTELHVVLAERDAAKKAEFLAQERQGAVQKYALDVEKKAEEAAAKAKAAVEKAERDAERKEEAATKKLDRMILLAKLLAAAIPIAIGIVHYLH